MHKLIFNARLTKDAEQRFTNDGKAVLDLSFAVNDWNGKEKTTLWIKGALWGKRAESDFAQYLTKGTPVVVEGRLLHKEGNPRTYQTNAGETRAGFEILVVDIDPFVAGKSANGDEDILF